MFALHLKCRLRALREDRGLSIKEAERQTGISRGTLSAIERGKALPADEHVEAIERVYGQAWWQWYSPAAAAGIQEGDGAA